jgi:hypothetical protein
MVHRQCYYACTLSLYLHRESISPMFTIPHIRHEVIDRNVEHPIDYRERAAGINY